MHKIEGNNITNISSSQLILSIDNILKFKVTKLYVQPNCDFALILLLAEFMQRQQFRSVKIATDIYINELDLKKNKRKTRLFNSHIEK